MKINTPQGTTRILGESQGYQPLPIVDGHTPEGYPVMTSSWQPSPEELERLIAGAPIQVVIVGSMHPPIWVEIP